MPSDARPASIAQVRKTKDGHLVSIEGDLLEVVAQVKDISPDLSVRWSVAGEYFAVFERTKEGKDELVLTTQQLDQRIVERLRLLCSKEYSYAKEVDRMDKEAERKADQKLHEEVGERGEVLAHALRKDFGAKPKTFVQRNLDGDDA